MRRLAIVLGVLAAVLLIGGSPALAVPPTQLSGQITDQVNALGGKSGDVQSALSNLESRKGLRLFVVYVPDFDGLDSGVWASQTFQQSRLGSHDVLFAVATQARKYGVDGGSATTRNQVEGIATSDAKPHLADGDWAGAAVAMADGLAGGSASSGSSGGSRSSGLVTLGVVLAILVLAGGGYMLFRGRRRHREEAAALPAGPTPQQAPRDPYEGVPTDQLNGRASTELLDVDEQARSAQVDLDFARTHFGEEAIPDFAEELQQSQGELARAFTIRQELDDEIPEDDPTQRRMLAELLALTGSAAARLKKQSDELAQLRDRERSAPQVVDDLAKRIEALQQRLPQQEKRLADLQQRYSGSALASATDNVNQAGVRLAAAAQAVEAARQDQAGGDAGRAVGRLRPAEGAVTQSATLLDAIDRLAADLAAADQRIAAARAETEADLAEARSLVAQGDPTGLKPLIARAEAEMASADAALRPAQGAPDPLGALRRLEEADAALDKALVGARDAQSQRRRAAGALEQALLTARSAVAAADDFIGARRGAVGPTARTRLAEAQRHLDAAQRQADSDPQTALREAQQADQLAQYALDLAQSDVEQWSQQTGYGPGWGGGYGGGWGGGYGRRGGSGLGWGLGGLLLGGLLFGDHDGGGGWGSDGGAGGGDWGGGGGDFGGGDWGGGGGDFGGGGGSF